MGRIALMFSGQGSQYVGMGNNLYENYEVARHVFEEANDAIGFDLKSLCFSGDIDELTRTENAQPCILTMSVAAYRVYMQEIGRAPLYFAGHSLGEISALTCAGAINFADAVKIVRQRGKLMQEAVGVGEGAMLAVSNVDRYLIAAECGRASTRDQIAVISNYNSEEQTVISGNKAAINTVKVKLEQNGAKCTFLKVSAPFHSPLMNPVADRFKEELSKYKFNELEYCVISNVTGLPYPGADSIIKYLPAQIVQPVKWMHSMKYIQEHCVEIAVELGPKKVLKNLIKGTSPEISAFSFDISADIKGLENAVFISDQRDKTKNKVSPPTVISKCLAMSACTKNRNFNEDEYQKGVIEPIAKIRKMHEEIVEKGEKPSVEKMEEALGHLSKIFENKKVPIEERNRRFKQILNQTNTEELFRSFIS